MDELGTEEIDAPAVTDDPGNAEFDKGYQDGLTGSGYRPSSLRYVQGYDSGKLAAFRLGLSRDQNG